MPPLVTRCWYRFPVTSRPAPLVLRLALDSPLVAEIEMLTLANHAEVQNGLLYVSGAGWDTVTRSYQEGEQPQPQHFSIAVSVLVPWMETNQPHRVVISVEDEDGHDKLMEATADIEVGRPPGKVRGSDSRSPLVVSGIVHFPRAGGYRVRATLAEEQRDYAFRVIDQVS